MFVLFGGGDAGGIYIGTDGKVHRIPPWNPEVLTQLKAVKSLAAVVSTIHDQNLVKEVSTLTERLSESVVTQTAKIAGVQLNASDSVAFFDSDGGFTCGTTGKHPVPFPGPHIAVPGFSPVETTVAR
jgi:hypothetical protein